MVRVLSWEAVPGRVIPSPRLADDRDRFPPEVVRQVNAWLASILPGFDLYEPTPIRIVMGPGCNSAEIKYGLDLTEVYPGYGQYIFNPGTIEVLFRDGKRKGPIIAKYRYLAARTPESWTIVGGELGLIQDREASVIVL